jgi:hypothetical protein
MQSSAELQQINRGCLARTMRRDRPSDARSPRAPWRVSSTAYVVIGYPERLPRNSHPFGGALFAKRNFLTSLGWARRRQAKSWEPRTSISLARSRQVQNKRQDAYDPLAPVYDWFKEGFDTRDLRDAK